MNPDDIREAVAKAEDDSLDLLDALTGVMAPNGLTWDMEEWKTDADVILGVLDLQQRPSPEFSVWTFLPQVSPELFAQLNTRYQRAISKTAIGAPR